MSNDERDPVEVLAHRIAWRYKVSRTPHQSDEYTFNRATLLQFAAELGQARAAIAQQPEAWGVETEDGAMLMVFLDKSEAATYCDGAEPVALGRIVGAAIAQPEALQACSSETVLALNDADKQKLEEARLLSMSMTSHPLAFSTIDHVERAGELLGLLWQEVLRLRCDLNDAKTDERRLDWLMANSGLILGRGWWALKTYADTAPDDALGVLDWIDAAIDASRAAIAQPAEPAHFPQQVPNEFGYLLTTEALWRMYVEDAPKAAQADAQPVAPDLTPDVTWLWTHCRALGMKRKSLSGSFRDDVALFVADLHAAAPPAPQPAADAQPVAYRDREADRARFPDPAFNRWLDEGISDAGHTVWDAVGDVQSAWSGWDNRQHYAAAPTARQPLTEDQIVACITEAGCHGGAMRMSYGSGPYEITRPTINAVELTRAIERAHGITPPTDKEPT